MQLNTDFINWTLFYGSPTSTEGWTKTHSTWTLYCFLERCWGCSLWYYPSERKHSLSGVSIREQCISVERQVCVCLMDVLTWTARSHRAFWRPSSGWACIFYARMLLTLFLILWCSRAQLVFLSLWPDVLLLQWCQSQNLVKDVECPMQIWGDKLLLWYLLWSESHGSAEQCLVWENSIIQ